VARVDFSRADLTNLLGKGKQFAGVDLSSFVTAYCFHSVSSHLNSGMSLGDSPPEQKILLLPNETIEHLRKAAGNCKACDLWEKATQTVFGEGGGRAPSEKSLRHECC
jgi:hypothetical protein